MKKKDCIKLVYILFLLAFLILLHQYINWKNWFDFSDVHHETFAVGTVALAFGILIGLRCKK